MQTASTTNHLIVQRCRLAFVFSVLPSMLALSAATTLMAQDRVDKKSNDNTNVKTEADITAILQTQAKAWNAGSLEQFMETYWKSDQLTFSGGGKTTKGWQATLDNYRKGYAPPKEMGHLEFDHLVIMMIESRSALVLGNWHLKMKQGQNKDGNFSLVLKQFDNGWKIVHDHSSTLPAAKASDIPEKK